VADNFRKVFKKLTLLLVNLGKWLEEIRSYFAVHVVHGSERYWVNPSEKTKRIIEFHPQISPHKPSERYEKVRSLYVKNTLVGEKSAIWKCLVSFSEPQRGMNLQSRAVVERFEKNQ
jgi:hypothetical protein